MSKYLVIVESPTKAKTIGKFLGKNYKVMSSMGHIRDLPKSQLGIDVENGFAPHYVTIRGKGEMLKELKKQAKSAEKVFYAADPDREGEAIAYHVKHYIEGQKGDALIPDDKPCRIIFNEITKDAILKAVKNPRPIDIDLVNAQQGRRILDRLVGYKLSPLLWQKVRKGLSAGRVQSVAVRLICEKQDEIDSFVPEEYWTLGAEFKYENNIVEAELAKIASKKAEIADEEAINAILKDLEGTSYIVDSVHKRERKKSPAPPFTTSSLQQEANQKLGYTAKRTMQYAQQLYEGISIGGTNVGLITYMRTDSLNISEVAQREAAEYIKTACGKQYAPAKPPVYTKSGRAQNAHEAIRPTSVNRTPAEVKEYLSPSQWKLYKLIWERFVASQMSPAVIENTTYNIVAGKYLFRATGSVVLFPGYMKIYKTSNKETILPVIAEKTEIALEKLKPEQHYTQAPAAFNEATLIKTLEKLGIGRPSTYVTIIETIVSRGYVTRKEKVFTPTELGRIVNDLLMEYFPDILNAEFTADMENELDKVEEGDIEWQSVIATFYGPFSKNLETAQNAIGKVALADEESDIVCDLCGRKMVYKMGRYGRFLACPGYPECKNIKSVDKDGNVAKNEVEESDVTCDLCGSKMVVKMGRYGKFLACPRYPECKSIKSIDEEIGVKCSSCGGELVKKRSKRGKTFYGCKNYPTCNATFWNLPLTELCPSCGKNMVTKTTKKDGTVVFCENKECPSNQNNEES